MRLAPDTHKTCRVVMMEDFDEAALARVASYFRALAEPNRLRILNALRAGPRSVSEIVSATGCGQANVSKHLAQLLDAGLVKREPRGTMVIYEIAEPGVFQLCDLVCGNVANILQADMQQRNAISAQLTRSSPEK